MEHVLLSGPGPPPRLAPAHCSQAQAGWGECAGARELTKETLPAWKHPPGIQAGTPSRGPSDGAHRLSGWRLVLGKLVAEEEMPEFQGHVGEEEIELLSECTCSVDILPEVGKPSAGMCSTGRSREACVPRSQGRHWGEGLQPH